MKTLLPVALCVALAACSQTSADADAYTSGPAAQSRHASKPADACEKAIQGQANASMLGGALGMVGGLGGLGGRGGAVAAQVASGAGGLIAQSQARQAQAEVMRECNRARS